MIVSFRPHRAPSAISLLPTVDRTVASASPAPRRAIPAKTSVPQTCARPTARVPLSADCEQARAISAFRVRLRYLPGSEVREAIVRGPSRISIRRVDTRPPPESKAVKKHPVAEVTTHRPVRQLGSGSRQPQLQPLDRGDLVVARPRARGAALARAAAVPLRPLAPAEHDSARRDRGSSPRSTRVAPNTTPFSATPEDSRAGGSRVDRGQMSFGRT